MSEVTITLTEEQIKHLPICGEFASKFRTALKDSYPFTYTLKGIREAAKLFYDIMKFHNYYNIVCEPNNVIKVTYVEYGVEVWINGTTVIMHTSSTSSKTTLERIVKNCGKLTDQAVTLAIDRTFATDYLKILVCKDVLYKYDRQVLKILMDVLI